MYRDEADVCCVYAIPTRLFACLFGTFIPTSFFSLLENVFINLYVIILLRSVVLLSVIVVVDYACILPKLSRLLTLLTQMPSG